MYNSAKLIKKECCRYCELFTRVLLQHIPPLQTKGAGNNDNQSGKHRKPRRRAGMGRRQSVGSDSRHGNDSVQRWQKPEDRRLPFHYPATGSRSLLFASSRNSSGGEGHPSPQDSQKEEIIRPALGGRGVSTYNPERAGTIAPA